MKNKDRAGRPLFPLRAQFTITFFLLMISVVLLCVLLNGLFLERFYRNDRIRAFRSCYETLDRAVTENTISSDAVDSELLKITGRENIGVIVMNVDADTLKSYASDPETMERRMWDHLVGNTPYLPAEEAGSGSTAGVSSPEDYRKTRYQAFYIVEDLEAGDDYTLQVILDKRTDTQYLEMWGILEDGSYFLLRSALESIESSSALAGFFFLRVGLAATLFGALLSAILAGTVTSPIRRLTQISTAMKSLDFSRRYEDRNPTEIGILGQNINELSDILERTISELKKANKELVRDIRKKEEDEAMRREFLRNVTHELKTPLALIQGYAEGLQEGISDDPESTAFYCDVIVDEARKMNLLVGKLLTLNELESGHPEVNMERFDISALVHNYLNTSAILAENAGAAVNFEDPGPVMVWADEFLVEEVLSNYFSNAVHHVSGEKVIDIRIEPKDNCVRISVFNTGSPIPEEDLPHLWEKFYKVDKARTRAYGGSGVGLSIVKAVMNLLRQDYGVINYDNGVRFWFELAADPRPEGE